MSMKEIMFIITISVIFLGICTSAVYWLWRLLKILRVENKQNVKNPFLHNIKILKKYYIEKKKNAEQ